MASRADSTLGGQQGALRQLARVNTRDPIKARPPGCFHGLDYRTALCDWTDDSRRPKKENKSNKEKEDKKMSGFGRGCDLMSLCYGS